MGKMVGVVLVVAFALSPLHGLASPASLGGGFADTYTAFAPLYALYRSYADYLFYGSEVVIPPGIGGACQSLSKTLPSLQAEMIVQTGSAEALTYIVHLRQSLDPFCSTYSSTIAGLAATSTPDQDLLKEAADKGFFAAVSNMNKLLERAFNSTLDGLPPGDPQWAFATAFVCRTLIDQPRITHIESTLDRILLGSDDTPSPPSDLPEGIMQSLKALSAYAGKDVTPAEVERVKTLAHKIYDFLLKRG